MSLNTTKTVDWRLAREILIAVLAVTLFLWSMAVNIGHIFLPNRPIETGIWISHGIAQFRRLDTRDLGGPRFIMRNYLGFSYQARTLNDITLRIPFWPIMVIGCTPLLRQAGMYARQRYRKSSGRCIFCGYDLRASQGICPECGRCS